MHWRKRKNPRLYKVWFRTWGDQFASERSVFSQRQGKIWGLRTAPPKKIIKSKPPLPFGLGPAGPCQLPKGS